VALALGLHAFVVLLVRPPLRRPGQVHAFSVRRVKYATVSPKRKEIDSEEKWQGLTISNECIWVGCLSTVSPEGRNRFSSWNFRLCLSTRRRKKPRNPVEYLQTLRRAPSLPGECQWGALWLNISSECSLNNCNRTRGGFFAQGE
jgi:hypothetical protein